MEACVYCSKSPLHLSVYTHLSPAPEPTAGSTKTAKGRRELRNYWMRDWPGQGDLVENAVPADVAALIHVCADCTEQAERDGYEYRADLTPSR